LLSLRVSRFRNLEALLSLSLENPVRVLFLEETLMDFAHFQIQDIYVKITGGIIGQKQFV